MTVRLERTQEPLVKSAVPVRGFLRLALGLMLRRPLVDEAWVFLLPWEGQWDLTNLFVLQDIDALWLDAERRVLKKGSLRAWQCREPGIPGTRFVIELPRGAARGVRKGDTLSWSF